ncbi:MULTISPECIES: ABC transporter ATP-binding protein [Microvirga]|uniref:ABC transporter ATP-binding protein n=1 Tax=Microvirga TaxID=186650 RepID=UPI00191CC80B|nr:MULTISPECIES: ABC transporter ATP-binding protein [Microvirga]MBM6583243.1 ABC transporter ATP-binding protein [Microvirga arvi]
MLTTQGLTKRFGGLVAVRDASISANAGDITALIGPNGAGKTTLFATVAGFLKPDAGSVTFGGRDITGMKPHQICDLGMVRTFQIVKPFGKLSVLDNIAVGAYARFPRRQDALAHAAAIGRQVGLGGQLEKIAAGLTVAGRKRLEVARALATSPRLLLLDEVMAGLTPTEIDEIVPIIFGIRDTGVTILLIEHVMQAVMRLSDRAYVLNEGHLIAEGTPQEVVREPAVIEAYLGPGAATRAQSFASRNAS